MLKINSKISVFISLILTAVMFAGTVALAFFVPAFSDYLLRLPDASGQIPEVTAFQRTAVCAGLYAELAVMLAGLGMLFALLILVQRKKVFTAAAVELIRFISWCLIFMGVILIALTFCRIFALFIGAAILFVGLTIRVVKNVIEAAVFIKEENDLTV